MLKHVVMWRFKEGADGKTRKEHAEWMKENLERLPEMIPEICSLEVGVNKCTGDMAYDAVLISVFRSTDDLKKYKEHPEHKKVSAYCKKVRESRTVVDFEF